VPLADLRLPPSARLRRLVSDLVQLRPILEDESRELLLELPGEPLQLVRYSASEPDPERPLLHDDEVELARASAHESRSPGAATDPAQPGPRRARRVVSSSCRPRRARDPLAGLEARPGARHLYGEVRCEGIERLQREALDAPRPHVVVRFDRSGLNDAHPLVKRLYATIERIVRPIVDTEERRAGTRLVRAGKEIAARDEVGLRALNDALRSAFDAPGRAGFARGGAARERPVEEPHGGVTRLATAASAPATVAAAMRFKQSPIRVHPGEQRTASLLSTRRRSRPGRRSRSRPTGTLRLPLAPGGAAAGRARLVTGQRKRARLVSAEPGSQLSVFAAAGATTPSCSCSSCATTPAAGCARSPARTRTPTSRPSSSPRLAPSPSTRAGGSSRRSSAPPARQAWPAPASANTSRTACSRSRSPRRRLLVGRRTNPRTPSPGRAPERPREYAAAVHMEAQLLRHRAHDKLMKAFLGPEVFEGTVVVAPSPAPPASEQLRLA